MDLSQSTDAKTRRAWKTRTKDGAGEIFSGALVNRTKLARDHLNNCPPAHVAKLVKLGMPFVRLPGSQRYWFSPADCLAWHLKHQSELNQPRQPRRRPTRGE